MEKLLICNCAVSWGSITTFIIGIIGVGIALLQWWSNRLHRKNQLFDLRYNFYQRLRNLWLATRADNNYTLDAEDLIPFAEEADFLFGKDIVNHIFSLEGKSHTGSPFFPNEDFSLPFKKYLELK